MMMTVPLLRITKATLRLVALSVSVLVFAVTLALLHAGWKLVPVLSGSMAPSIDTDALAVVRPIPVSDVRAGDVIAYRSPQSGQPFIIHRVVDSERQNAVVVMRTKGDANDAVDSWPVRFEVESHVLRHEATVPGIGPLVQLLSALGVQGALAMSMTVAIAITSLLVIWHKPAHVREALNG